VIGDDSKFEVCLDGLTDYDVVYGKLIDSNNIESETVEIILPQQKENLSSTGQLAFEYLVLGFSLIIISFVMIRKIRF